MSLNVSECFYSIQAEGVSSGVPSVFIRLQGCNLMSIGVKPGRKIPKVWTPTGMKKINEIKAGDIVLSVDENNKLTETVVKIVTEYDIDNHVEIKMQDKSSIYTSHEHPFLTNNGWVSAGSLKDQEVMHFNYKDFLSYIKKGDKNPMNNRETVNKRLENVNYKEIGKKISKTRKDLFSQNKLKSINTILKEQGLYDNFIKNTSNRMKNNNPMFDPVIVKKSQGAHNSKGYKGYASMTEYKFHSLCKKMGLPVKYIGNFDLAIPIKNTKKHIYPDFIIEGSNRLVEVLYSKGRYANRDDKWKENRKKIVNDAGYDIVFADFDDKENINNLIKYELDALNGVKVTDVKRYNANKLKCYDLTCYPHHTFIVDGLVTHNCGGPSGSLMKEGKATWWCDSEAVWKNGTTYTNEEIEKKLVEFGELDSILNGTTHIVWTGGEPTIPRCVTGIMEFLDYMKEKYPQSRIYNEIETNGTNVVPSEFYTRYIQQINCSPKLSNSGMIKSIRVNKDALSQIKLHDNYWFKFVISEEWDIDEIMEDFIREVGIHNSHIILMPGCDNAADLAERTKFVWEMAMHYHWRMCTRLHILCFNKLCGV